MIMLECAYNNKTIYSHGNNLIYVKVLKLFKSKLNVVFICKRDQPLIGLGNKCRGLNIRNMLTIGHKYINVTLCDDNTIY